jgi:hypothetical protein
MAFSKGERLCCDDFDLKIGLRLVSLKCRMAIDLMSSRYYQAEHAGRQRRWGVRKELARQSCHCEEPQATKQSQPRVGTVAPRLLPPGTPAGRPPGGRNDSLRGINMAKPAGNSQVSEQ